MKSRWHYQIMRHHAGKPNEYYAVHEYYEGDLEGCTMRPITITGEDVEDIKSVLKMIESDIYKHGIKDYVGSIGEGEDYEDF